MSNWIAKKLDIWVNSGDIVLGRGNIISKDDINTFLGSYPIYSSSAHNNGKFGEYAKHMFDEELITWSIDGGGNLFYRPRHKFSVTNVCGFMRIKTNELHTPFVYYCLSNQHKNLTFDYTTKAHPSVIRKIYWLPKIEIGAQEKIADILSTIDRTITHTEALIEKYQQIKAGLMHDLFTRGIGADGKLRPPRDQAPELYQESSIGWIPKEWEVKSVESLGGLVTSGSRDWAQYYSDEGDLFIRIGNLTREHINFRLGRVQYVSPPRNSDGQRTKLMGGDILVSITADLGIIGVIPNELGDAYINQHIALIRFYDQAINSRFFGHFFASKAFQKYVDRMNDGGAKAGLNLPAVRAFPVVMTSKNEQDNIVQRLDSIDVQVDIEKKVLLKLCQQKSGLMQDLLTGAVQVNIDPV